MTDRPIVRLTKEPGAASRIPGSRRPRFPRRADSSDQAAKFGDYFSRIEQTVSELGEGIDVSSDPTIAAPDRALVFDVKGSITKFFEAARAAGFEWIGEALDPDLESEGDETLGIKRLYLTMPTREALDALVRYWKLYQADDLNLKEWKSEWGTLFGWLSELRVWSAQDRVDVLAQRFIESQLRKSPHAPVTLEFDLWYRNDPEARARAFADLVEIVRAANGEVLDHAEIAPIEYFGALVRLPAAAAAVLAGRSGPLATADFVMSVRPQSVFDTREIVGDEEGRPYDAASRVEPYQNKEPIVALLDGYPVGGHELLRDYVDVSEVDVVEADVPPDRRYHGTAMASLIVHGDLDIGALPINRSLKVVPVLTSSSTDGIETTPPDKLAIAMIYRAVTALKSGLGDAPSGRDVVIVNHSICDAHGPFHRVPSTWARLLDYLSFKHNILFVVSAGNVFDSFDVEGFDDADEFALDDRSQRQASIIRGLIGAKRSRRILSPAESVNSITVGALHSDEAGACPPGHVDPFPPIGMTNLCSALGLGFAKSVKPDFVLEGGRQVARAWHDGSGLSVWGEAIPQIGQLVASPAQKGANPAMTARCSGTSNAAALATRSAVMIADEVEKLYWATGENWLNRPSRAAILKALMSHGCEWGEGEELLSNVHPPETGWQKRREVTTRFLGYGVPQFSKVVGGDHNRVTFLADDLIAHQNLHEYRIPIPSAMLNSRELRRIVLTLAWMTPIRPNFAPYRSVALDIVDQQGKRGYWKGVDAVPQPHPDAVRRGTVIHCVLEGRRKAALQDLSGLFVGVQARALHDDFQRVPVPYALAVTLEIGDASRSDIYQDVLAQIRARAARERAI